MLKHVDSKRDTTSTENIFILKKKIFYDVRVLLFADEISDFGIK